MAINKNIRKTHEPVMWDGEEAATVRGLAPKDVTDILMAEGESINALLGIGDAVTAKARQLNIPGGNTVAIADLVMAEGSSIMMQIAGMAPVLLARIIAVAGDDNTDENVLAIADWPLPLQFEVLSRIARLTFVGVDGFRMFVGNVQTLVATVTAMTNVNPNTPTHVSQDLDGGSMEFANSVPLH